MLGCFNPSLGQIWTNSAIGLHVCFNPTFGFVHIWLKGGLKQPNIFLECNLQEQLVYDPGLSASLPGFEIGTITACFHSAGIDPSSHTILINANTTSNAKSSISWKVSYPNQSLPGVVCHPRLIDLLNSYKEKNITITSLLSLFLFMSFMLKH